MAASSSSTLVVPSASWVKPALYGTLNIASATGIVFANKAVLSVYGFEFATALTLLHTLTTVLGMMLFCQLGMFTPKHVPALQVRQSASVNFSKGCMLHSKLKGQHADLQSSCL